MKNFTFLLLCLLPFVSCSQSKNTEINRKSTSTPMKPEDVFTTLQFELDGKPCVAVINNQYKNFKTKSLFPLSLFLTVNTLDKNKDAHPTELESKLFHELQTKIIRELSNAFALCHVGTTTMYGYRDIIFYINQKDESQAIEILNSLKEENERFKSYTFEPDPEWEAVASFYDAIPTKN